MSALQKKGHKAKLKKYDKEGVSRLTVKAVNERWKKVKINAHKSEHEGK
jgi:hypothetical protein